MTSQIPSTRDSTAARVTSEMSGQRQYESRPPPHALLHYGAPPPAQAIFTTFRQGCLEEAPDSWQARMSGKRIPRWKSTLYPAHRHNAKLREPQRPRPHN
jgi:hypothetical protein